MMRSPLPRGSGGSLPGRAKHLSKRCAPASPRGASGRVAGVLARLTLRCSPRSPQSGRGSPRRAPASTLVRQELDGDQAPAPLVEQILGFEIEAVEVPADPEGVGPVPRTRDADPATVRAF